MKQELVVPFVIIAIVYGIILGMVSIILSKKLALTRTDDPGKLAPLNKPPLKITAAVLGIGASFGLLFLTAYPETYGFTINDSELSELARNQLLYGVMVRNLILLIPIFSISFVDALVRKIPNPLLIVMLLIDIAYVVYVCVITPSNIGVILSKSFIGLFLGMLVCFIPSVLKIPMGAGDIKYSAVIGATIGAMGYFQSMILMSLFVVVFWIYLKATKKGGLKTQIPMGPFLSIGTVISMCFSLVNSVASASLVEFA